VLEDLSGSVEVTLFEESLVKARDFIAEDLPLILEGRLEVNDDRTKAKMVVSEVYGLEEALNRIIDKVQISLNQEQAATARLGQLQDILERHRGDCPVLFQLELAECEVTMSADRLKLQPSAELAGAVREIFGGRVIEFVARNGENRG
jgi:DNA polymerase-3 subunit alpha